MKRAFVNNKNQYDKFVFTFLGNLFFTICIVIALALMLFSITTTECLVENISMQPTFNYPDRYKNDTVFINKYNKDYNYEDIIVINLGDGKDAIIKRIVGLPGDIIDIVEQNNLYKLERNGEIVEEPYIFVDPDPTVPTYIKDGMHDTYKDFNDLKSRHPEYFNESGKLVVGENSLYVLGDNRAHSDDSNFYGLFKFNQVEGIVELVKYNNTSTLQFYWDYIFEGKFIYTFINIF